MAESNPRSPRHRITLLAVWTVVVLAVPAWSILDKERLVADGRTVLLDLAPVDPRSLIQGDYMALRYAFPDSVLDRSTFPTDGWLVLTVGQDSIAHIERLYTDGEPLGPDEQLLRYRKRGEELRLGAESFLFQEGQAEVYQPAEYGELRVAGDGESILIGLRDAERRRLGKPVF